MEPFELKAVEDMTAAQEKQATALSKLAVSLYNMSNVFNAAIGMAFIKGLVVGGLIVWLVERAFFK